MEKKVKTIINSYRTHHGGQLDKAQVGKKVRLSGWVNTRRDHGGLIFIDLRDKWGLTQLTFNPESKKEAWEVAEKLRSEYVITIAGEVKARPKKMVNKSLATGEIEVEVSAITVLSKAKTLPFEIDVDENVNEELRLKYRFLDLRHTRLQKMLMRRDEFITYVRSHLHNLGFVEVQTPLLANSSPEGARDFLVPSRLYPGKFYALPQAPQQYKQLLMVGGVERYFQIAPCFRDEDPRADRHAGAFYQIDMEMSFVEQEDVFDIIEPLMVELTKRFSAKKIMAEPFPRLPWREAMNRYGSDKPDLRYELFITSVTEVVKGTEFKVFEQVIGEGGVIHALHVQGGADFSRRDIDKLTELAKSHGAGGLAYLVIKEKVGSPLLKYLGEKAISRVVDKVGAKSGDIIFFGAGSWLSVCKVLGAVRVAAAEKLKLDDDSKAAWCWITDFPMYERDDEGKIDFSHNPFSMPQGGLKALQVEDPTTILGYQYDLALNGFEISSGAIRNHKPEIMFKAFALAGYSEDDVREKFGGMITAFEYGAPPHGGFAPGLDRLMMVLWDEPNIRGIYAFPKNGKAQDLMMNSPSAVDSNRLKELHIAVNSED